MKGERRMQRRKRDTETRKKTLLASFPPHFDLVVICFIVLLSVQVNYTNRINLSSSSVSPLVPSISPLSSERTQSRHLPEMLKRQIKRQRPRRHAQPIQKTAPPQRLHSFLPRHRAQAVKRRSVHQPSPCDRIALLIHAPRLNNISRRS